MLRLRITPATTYAQIAATLGRAHVDDEFLPYTDADGMLVGVLSRADVAACLAHRVKAWEAQRAAVASQMGAATRALCKPTGHGNVAIQCTSLKSNVGHLEPAAAAAGLASLVVGPLMASVVAVNAQLRGYVLCVFTYIVI